LARQKLFKFWIIFYKDFIRSINKADYTEISSNFQLLVIYVSRPDNIVRVDSSSKWKIKLDGFLGSKNDSKSIRGTPFYMSPQMLRG
jgi:hypothetical protein